MKKEPIFWKGSFSFCLTSIAGFGPLVELLLVRSSVRPDSLDELVNFGNCEVREQEVPSPMQGLVNFQDVERPAVTAP